MTTYTHCTRCDAKLRSNRLSVKQAPGTKPHAGNGLCGSCRRRDRVAEQKAKAGNTDFDVEFARYALKSFLDNLPSHRKKTAA